MIINRIAWTLSYLVFVEFLLCLLSYPAQILQNKSTCQGLSIDPKIMVRVFLVRQLRVFECAVP